jgi:thiol-disulfide isomerase/thioredoxin
MVEGLIVLVVVLAASSVAGVVFRVRQGRFREIKATSISGTVPAPSPPGAASGTALSEADLGAPLGPRATLVQFSTEFCAYCGPTRQLLAEIARDADGVAFVEIDAAARMDLTRRLGVLATPTILVLGPDGAIAKRASGRPRKAEVLAAVGGVTGDSGVTGESGTS